jgi:hypothetical protein
MEVFTFAPPPFIVNAVRIQLPVGVNLMRVAHVRCVLLGMGGMITLGQVSTAVLLFSAVALFGQDTPASPGPAQPGAQGQPAAAQDTAALAKATQNPVASLISVPSRRNSTRVLCIRLERRPGACGFRLLCSIPKDRKGSGEMSRCLNK